MLGKILVLALSLGLLTPVTPFVVPHVVYVGPQLSGVKIGPLDPNSTVTLVVLIPPKDAQELYLLAQEIGKGQIHMTKAQLFQSLGDPTKAEEVSDFLKSHGFNVQVVTPVEVVAYSTAYNVEKAFGVTLYLYNFSGQVYYAPSSTPPYVSALKGTVVLGLTNFTKVQPMYYSIPLGYYEGSKFVPAMNGTNFHLTFQPLSLLQIAQAYNVSQDGKGVNVAIIDMYGDPTLYQDLALLDSKYHLPPANVTIIPLGPYEPTLGIISGWGIETALDVETVHAMAPYAHIYLMVASNALALFAAIPYVVSALNVSVVSMSWGLPENLVSANGMFIYFQGLVFPNIPYLDFWFALGSALGTTFVASSGDGGAFSYTMTSYGGTSWPASSPFVLAAGGTSLYPVLVNGSYGYPNSTVKYGYETAWSIMPFNFPLIGGGGGVSALEPKLPFQPGNYSSRLVPDVAADANPYTGAVVYAYGIAMVIGGTSLAAPIWAGVIADLESQLHKDFGWLNPLLYQVYDNSTLYNEAFHQVTFGFNGIYYAHLGYNLVTGLGSPNYYGLLKALNHTLAKPELKVSVTTFAEGYSLPWYNTKTTFEIVAFVTYPNGTIVNRGKFTAFISTSQGIISEVPLKFNGTYWVGRYTILPTSPGGEWLVYVNGTSSSWLNGYGASLVDVGPSVAIVYPIPFPYSYYLPPNTPLRAVITAYNINGTPMNLSSVKGDLVMYGKVIENLTFIQPSGGFPGEYVAQFSVITGTPQGVYLMFVNGTGFSVFTYVTVGLNLLAVGIPQVIGSESVVSKGQKLVLFSETFATDTGLGLFTSNVTAYVYSPQGKLVEVVHLTPAPATTQFGVVYAFGLQEANLTLNSTEPGWYKVVLSGVYNSTAGPEYGNYTMWFYYSPVSVKVTLVKLGSLTAGQVFLVNASITYPNGTPVTYGSFIANVVPNYLYPSAINYEVANAVQLSYNSTTKTWTGLVTLPSQFNETLSGISGNSYSLSGTWDLEIVGSSPLGSVDVYFPVTVSPQAYLYLDKITPENLDQLTTNGVLNGVSSYSLTIEGVRNLVIYDSQFGLLNVTNSSVVIVNSRIHSLYALNSNVTVVNSLIYDSPLGVYSVGSNVKLMDTPFVNVSSPYYVKSGAVEVYPTSVPTYYEPLTLAALAVAVIALIMALSRRR